MQNSKIYLVPAAIDENALNSIPLYIMDAVKDSQVIFAENERSARRFLKSMDKSIVIDDYEWHTIHKVEAEQVAIFKQRIKEGKNIAIISEAGCPGVADPGQILIEAAQQMDATVKPLVGPSSILLALMASGLNGQQFQFNGYLPIDNHEKNIKIKALEEESAKKKCTQIFIETPYRNNPMLEALLKNCKESTLLCIASELTSEREFVKTKTIGNWKKEKFDLHKKPVIFLFLA
jgi:16S rRNA (cytidine1402-2'-O)-methyltransferase